MSQFSYTIKGITETQKTLQEVETELKEACEEATDDGLHEVTEVTVEVVATEGQ